MENATTKAKSRLGWRILRWGLIGLAGLVTLAALLLAEENWRGKRNWENYKRECEAKGEKLDLSAFIAPPVPDEKNFAMTPFLAPLFEFNPKPLKEGQSMWRDTNAVKKVEDFANDMGSPKNSSSRVQWQRMDLTAWSAALGGKNEAPASGETLPERAASAEGVLQKLEKYEAVIEELQTASRRPYCQFNAGYPGEDPQGILFPHLSIIKRAETIFNVRACAELAAGKSDLALEDVKLSLYLAECAKDEPALLPGLVRVSMASAALQPIWEGLADRRWSEAQLKELQGRLGKVDLLADYEYSMSSERAYGNAAIDYQRRATRLEVASDDSGGAAKPEYIRNSTPSGWYYHNQLVINLMYQQVFQPGTDASKHRVYLELSTNKQAELDQALRGRFPMYTVFARMLFPAFMKAEQKFAYAQASVDEAVIACALERYRLTYGAFPEKLEALSPQFIEKVPLDLITGAPLKYRRADDGQFILYSGGWNGTDDGGIVVMNKNTPPTVDVTQGDWVWKYPASR